MRIDDNGSLVVLAPSRMSRRRIDELVVKHYDWIEKKSGEVRDLPQPLADHTYRDGDTFLLLGRELTLRLREGYNESVSANPGALDVVCRSCAKRHIQLLIHQFYDSCGLEIYEPLVNRYLEELGVSKEYVTVRMANYPKRLGSCSHDKVLSFSRRSLMLPENLIEYVALHEVAHLVYFNHGKGFKELIASRMGDYRERYQQIKTLRLQISHL